MKKIFLFLIVIAFVASPVVTEAISWPFGGVVTVVYPCNTGLLVYLKNASSIPSPVIPLMWIWGNLQHGSYVPPHPAQRIMGRMLLTPVPCVLGTIPVGYGFPIIYHGSSI